MKFDSNRNKGNAGIGMAIAYFTSMGYTVSIPLNDTQDYDLIIDMDTALYRVQVKSTGCETKYGNYQVALKSCGGTKGTTYKTIKNTIVDFVFILTKSKELYLIPTAEFENLSTITLGKKYDKYKVHI